MYLLYVNTVNLTTRYHRWREDGINEPFIYLTFLSNNNTTPFPPHAKLARKLRNEPRMGNNLIDSDPLIRVEC
jgi:hypothetical protein